MLITRVKRPENFYASHVTFIPFFFICNNLIRALFRVLCACIKFYEKIDKRVESKEIEISIVTQLRFVRLGCYSSSEMKISNLSWTCYRTISVNAFIFYI